MGKKKSFIETAQEIVNKNPDYEITLSNKTDKVVFSKNKIVVNSALIKPQEKIK